MIDIRRHARGTIRIRPPLVVRVESLLDYYRQKAGRELWRDLGGLEQAIIGQPAPPSPLDAWLVSELNPREAHIPAWVPNRCTIRRP